MNYCKRGQLYYAKLDGIGSEQSGERPVVIIQNDIGNKHSPTTIVACITSRDKHRLPTHVYIGTEYTHQKDSTIMLEQLRTIDKSRLLEFIGQLDYTKVKEINKALIISLSLC